MPPIRTPSIRAVPVAAAAAVVAFMAFAPAEAAGVDGTSARATPTSKDFYLRAGIALDWSEETRFREKDCAAPVHLYGCGPGSDGAPLSGLGDFGTMAGVEVGLGYAVSPLLRFEGNIQYRPSFSFRGLANFPQDAKLNRRRYVQTDLSSLSAMLAAYLDLAELGLPPLGPFSPFVGGGMGLSRIETDETRMEYRDSKTTTIVRGAHRTNFAWMLTTGVAAPLGKRTTLDLAWRYTHSGTVETGRGGEVVCRIEMCSFGKLLEFDFAETRARLASHGLHASVRYAF